jgi:N-carbamoyl-D-amino-acid hydrolase
MPRHVHVAAAQLGPVARDHTRAEVVDRLVALLHDAHSQGAELVVFPELALTTFFPRWFFEDQTDVDVWFEREMPGPESKVLFDEAARLHVGFVLGFAELTPDGHHFNTAVLVDRDGEIVHRYRKVHLPGHDEHEPWRAFQHLEKRYFEPGPDGFTVCRAFGGVVGLLICNDRRWPEAYRSLGLQGVELVCVGYNTPVHNPPAPDHDRLGEFHNHLVMQSGAYQNGTWVVGVAKAGDEEGVPMIGGSCVIAPSGEIVALCSTLGDEVVVHRCDLDAGRSYTTSVFDLGRHREPDAYWRITAQKGAEPPPE